MNRENDTMSLIKKFFNLYRSMIEDINLSSNRSVIECQQLKSYENWDCVCNCMDNTSIIICAIEDYINFGASGHVVDYKRGEYWLRIKGVLSEVFNLNDIIMSLCTNTSTKKGGATRLKGHKLNTIRNKIAAHSSNYNKGGTKSYRFTEAVDNKNKDVISIIWYEGYKAKSEDVNIREELKSYTKLLLDVLVELCTNRNRLLPKDSELKEEFDNLKFEKEGKGYILKLGNQKPQKIKFDWSWSEEDTE